jgi:hypothetical protein
MEIRKMELREGGYAVNADGELVELECTQSNGVQGKFIVIATLDELAESLLVWSRIVNAARALRQVSVLEGVAPKSTAAEPPAPPAAEPPAPPAAPPNTPYPAPPPPATAVLTPEVAAAVRALDPAQRHDWIVAVLRDPAGFAVGAYDLALELLAGA